MKLLLSAVIALSLASCGSCPEASVAGNGGTKLLYTCNPLDSTFGGYQVNVTKTGTKYSAQLRLLPGAVVGPQPETKLSTVWLVNVKSSKTKFAADFAKQENSKLAIEVLSNGFIKGNLVFGGNAYELVCSKGK